ncbi:hypothetical protein TCSYLVIO_008341 [Trypanosoma cruzi]|nr:hypothetical protein TCSYLVIO_008341 [Trypanosoma cruzi]
MGHNQRPSSGWTSRQSAFRLKAAGTVFSARVFSCAKVKAPFLQPNAPSKEFTVQRQKKTQCPLLSHGSVVDALMRTVTHRFLQTKLHTCNASCALRCILPTVNKINLAVGGDYIVKESGIRQSEWHDANDWTAILQRGARQCPHTTRRCGHAQHQVRIGNTSGTMPSTHREPTANATRGKWGHNQRPSSGWTSRQSAFRLKAAGTVFSARVFSCAKVKAPFLQPNAPSKEFTVQRQKKTQCPLLSHGSVVDALMRTVTHRFLQTKLHTCNASCALRCILPTVNKINLAVGGDYIVKESGIRQSDNKATAENHTADIITKRRNSARGRGVTSIN